MRAKRGLVIGGSIVFVIGLAVLAAITPQDHVEPVPSVAPRYFEVADAITPPPPGFYVSWATTPYPPPTRAAGGGNQAFGINAGYFFLYLSGQASTWGSAPTGCTESSCTTSNIDWSVFDGIIAGQAAYNIKLANGATRTSPSILTLPALYIDAEGDSSCGSSGDPCNRVTIPAWLATDCKFTYTVTVNNTQPTPTPYSWQYEGFRYDSALCLNRLKQYISEAATRYGNNNNVVGMRLNVGIAGESQPTKANGGNTYQNGWKGVGTTTPTPVYRNVTDQQVIAAHEKTVSCTEYVEFIQALTEHAYSVWTQAKGKPLYVMAGPAPCSSGMYSNAGKLRWNLENNIDVGGWNLPGSKKMIGYSLNANPPDIAGADTLPGNDFGTGYDLQPYQWYTFGDYTFEKGVGITYESYVNPNHSTTNGDNWAYQVWNWYAMAGAHTDFAQNNYLWQPYFSSLFWEVNDYLISDKWPYRGWVLFRDAEWITSNWLTGYGESGYRGNWRNWLNLPNYDAYGQACNAFLRKQVSDQKSTLTNRTIYHEPCEALLPTPAVTPRPTLTPGDTVDEMNRTFNRQALTLSSGGATSEMDVAIDTTHPNAPAATTTTVTVTLAYLDAGTDQIHVLLPGVSNPITNTLTKSNSGQWKRYTFTQSGVRLENNLTGVNNAAFVILKNDGTRTEYLHELWVDIPKTLSVPTATPTLTPSRTPTPTQTPTRTPTPSVTPTPNYPTGVRFNEISPNEFYDWNLSGDVSANDRFFELINWQSTAADITGWTVNNGSVTFTIPDGVTIQPREHLVFLAEDVFHIPASGTLTLREGATVRSSLPYGAQSAGLCYAAKPDGSTTWESNVTCTPGRAN